MKRISYILFGITWVMCIISTQVKASEFDVQNLIRCYDMERDNWSYAAKKAYFDAFPTTFDAFKKIFGYEETQYGENYGELYEESLDYVSEFFNLNKDIDLSDFSDKVICICINGGWQADGVNYLKANIVNVITSSNFGQDCYYNYSDILICFNDTLRDTLLSRLTLCSDDEILSFWKFYLDSPRTVPVDSNLYNITRRTIREYSNLIKQLDKAYKVLSRQNNDVVMQNYNSDTLRHRDNYKFNTSE